MKIYVHLFYTEVIWRANYQMLFGRVASTIKTKQHFQK